MKIEGPNRTRETAPSRKKDAASSSGGAGVFGGMLGANVSGSAPTGTTQSIAMVDMLLAVQSAEDPTERAARRRVRERADGLLTELDKIRMAMLTGTMTVGHMVDIADVIASHRDRINDPQLTEILDEIDLRAQIELAKMRMTLDQKPS